VTNHDIGVRFATKERNPVPAILQYIDSPRVRVVVSIRCAILQVLNLYAADWLNLNYSVHQWSGFVTWNYTFKNRWSLYRWSVK
jgi:hypothetical protein